MNAIYLIWGSEDEGFRFPLTENAYTHYEDALAVAKKVGGKNEIEFTIEDLDDMGAPCAHGEVVTVLSCYEDVKSIDDALENVISGDDRSDLYACDWVFIMKVDI